MLITNRFDSLLNIQESKGLDFVSFPFFEGVVYESREAISHYELHIPIPSISTVYP